MLACNIRMSNNTPLDVKNLILWKHIWDLVISEEKFRAKLLTGPTFTLNKHSFNNRKITAKKGSLYIEPSGENGDDEGHFVAYELSEKSITIFDPSGYAYQQFDKTMAKKVSAMSGKKAILLNIHPQEICTGDTFCQTWSLAWLNSKLREKTVGLQSPKDAIKSMYKIVTTIIKSPKFTGFILKHKSDIDSWITEARTKGKKYFNMNMTNTMIANCEDFIHFSRQVDKNDIEYIMSMTDESDSNNNTGK